MESFTDLSPLLEAIVAFMDDGIIIADERGKVLYQNPAAGALLGAPPNEPILSLERAGAFDLKARLERTPSAFGANFVRFEERIKTPYGPRDVEFQTGLIDVPTLRQRLRLVIANDRTEQRQLEDVFRHAAGDLVTNDPRMLEILGRIQQVAPTNASVMLQGESGTGKTQVARLVHHASPRAPGPFVEVNCAAIPESLIESELFGHVKGAFTGAHQHRPGRFQAAHRGTLLLDEVGEIPLHLQAKLLKAVQAQEFEPVGSDKPVKVDVRVISASNRSLRDMVDDGDFRADLYYRLAVIPLHIPPLRERPGDIPHLLAYFCKKAVRRGYPEGVTCSPEAMGLLMDYPWPGNVRELENAVEHGIICAVDKTVMPHSLPQDIREHDRRRRAEPAADRPAADDDADRQRRAIEAALSAAGGNRALAARRLGVDRTTLWRRMQRLGISAEPSRTTD